MQRLCGGGLRHYLGRSRPHAAARAAAPCAAMRWVMVEKSAEAIVPETRTGGLEYARLNWGTRKLDLGRAEPIRWADLATLLHVNPDRE